MRRRLRPAGHTRRKKRQVHYDCRRHDKAPSCQAMIAQCQGRPPPRRRAAPRISRWSFHYISHAGFRRRLQDDDADAGSQHCLHAIFLLSSMTGFTYLLMLATKDSNMLSHAAPSMRSALCRPPAAEGDDGAVSATTARARCLDASLRHFCHQLQLLIIGNGRPNFLSLP